MSTTMTPEQIVSEITSKWSLEGMESAEEYGIEAIKQYAREMCIEQKKNCLYSAENAEKNELTLHDSILRANFPKELQS